MLNPDTAFCSNCGAPQVRVPDSVTQSSGTELPSSGSGEDGVARTVLRLNWRHALPSASTAALAMAIASMLPKLNAFFPLWMIGGGLLAVVLYGRRSMLPQVSSVLGGKVGALAGLLGFLFFAVFISAYMTIATVVLHQGEQIRAQLRGVLEQAAANNHDASTQQVLQWVQTPEGLAAIMVLSMFLFLIAFLLLSTAGGIFGAALARRKGK